MTTFKQALTTAAKADSIAALLPEFTEFFDEDDQETWDLYNAAGAAFTLFYAHVVEKAIALEPQAINTSQRPDEVLDPEVTGPDEDDGQEPG